ncbi:MAG: cytochrome c biogenesis protein CcsA [Bacteroidota bacterium]
MKGNGLNPLLQNYWMTIHPPTLFLGFASTTIPFTFAIAGLWTGQHKAWLKPALGWALFSGGILGTGILMGGAWAYEALSFGGYWAWDPVENMSLVPWLILIAGIHTNLVAKATGGAIKATYVYYLLTFLLIVYSTFLTRSGVLGETSVHAFTEMGLEWQLVAFIGAFTGLSIGLMIWKFREVPTPKKEEPVASKEFWMFIGTLILLFSAIIITASTSLPVYNKIMTYFDPVFEGKVITDPVPHYNKYQIWIAIFIAFLSSCAQFLRYREINFKKHFRSFGLSMLVATLIALPLTYLINRWTPAQNWQYSLLLFAGVFATVSNLSYLLQTGIRMPKMVGSALSHIGFGVMLVGIIASGVNKRIISSSPFVMEGLLTNMDDDEGWRKNLLLFKGTPMIMEDYELTYVSDTLVRYDRTYTLNFKRKAEDGSTVEEFNIYPMVQYNKEYTKIASSNPSTRHYFGKDIFTYVSGLPEVEMNFQLRKEKEDSLNYKRYYAGLGETFTIVDTVELKDKNQQQIRSYQVRPIEVNRNPSHQDYEREPGDIPIGLKMEVRRSDKDSLYIVEPIIVLRGQLLYTYPSQVDDLSTKFRVGETIFEQLLTPDDELDYQEFVVKQGESFAYKGFQMQFAGFNKSPEHPNYVQEEGDIAVGAMVSVQTPNQANYVTQPVFFIRENLPYNIKDEIIAEGLHIRFVKLNPNDETATILIAQSTEASKIPFEMATDSFSSSWIVLQAIEFPGINLFWLGSIMMMLGMFWSMWYRSRKKAQQV